MAPKGNSSSMSHCRTPGSLTCTQEANQSRLLTPLLPPPVALQPEEMDENANASRKKDQSMELPKPSPCPQVGAASRWRLLLPAGNVRGGGVGRGFPRRILALHFQLSLSTSWSLGWASWRWSVVIMFLGTLCWDNCLENDISDSPVLPASAGRRWRWRGECEFLGDDRVVVFGYASGFWLFLSRSCPSPKQKLQWCLCAGLGMFAGNMLGMQHPWEDHLVPELLGLSALGFVGKVTGKKNDNEVSHFNPANPEKFYSNVYFIIPFGITSSPPCHEPFLH